MTNYQNTATKLEYLDISLVRTDGGTQPRAALNLEMIDEYSEVMNEGKEFPPVTVFYDGNTYWLADGFHRLEAAKKISSPTIPVDVRQGTRREAILCSVGANATHGLRRSNADKRRSVLMLLNDFEWSKWSNIQIAKQCGVDEGLVRKLKAQLTSDSTKIEPIYAKKCGVDEAILREVQQRLQAQTPERTACRQGKTYILNTSNIGKHDKQSYTAATQNKVSSANETAPFKENFEARSVKTSSTSTSSSNDLEVNLSSSKTIKKFNEVSEEEKSSEPEQSERLLSEKIIVQFEYSQPRKFVVKDDLQSQFEVGDIFYVTNYK